MAATEQETIIPFDDLPSCAADCGPLFDANGACAPPITAQIDESCFCAHNAVSGFKQGLEGVCDDACSNEDDLVAIQNWFAETCDAEAVEADGGDSGGDSSDDSGDGDSSGGTSPSSNVNTATGQSWVEMHWRWLVMIIILVIAIIAIWIGAFWWRRRHLRKKELKRSLGKRPDTASWGPGAAPPETEAAVGGVFANNGSSDSSGPLEKPKPGRTWWGGRKAG